MENIIDARNLSCPEPVILTKRAMEKNPNMDLIAIVNEKVALENVSRLATSQGYNVEIEEKGDGTYLHLNINRDEMRLEEEKGDIAILVTSNLFGKGSEELGGILMRSFLYTLTEMAGRINSLIFMNSGVYLTSEDSPVIEHLLVLQDSGVEILSCGTCLDFYELKEKFLVGKITNMYMAMEILSNATKSITI